VRQLAIKVLNIIDARCNHEIYYTSFNSCFSSAVVFFMPKDMIFYSLSIRLSQQFLFSFQPQFCFFQLVFHLTFYLVSKRTKTSQLYTLITSKELSQFCFLFNSFVFFLVFVHCFLASFSPISCYFCPSS